MLVLSRRKDEQLTIGDDIKITILEIRGSQVRLGVDAPKDVAILRTEPEVRPAECSANG